MNYRCKHCKKREDHWTAVFDETHPHIETKNRVKWRGALPPNGPCEAYRQRWKQMFDDLENNAASCEQRTKSDDTVAEMPQTPEPEEVQDAEEEEVQDAEEEEVQDAEEEAQTPSPKRPCVVFLDDPPHPKSLRPQASSAIPQPALRSTSSSSSAP